MTRDGRFVLRAGMVSQGYCTDVGRWIPNADLVGLAPDGEPLERVPSTLGTPQVLQEALPTDVFDLRVTTVYLLEAQEVDEALVEALDSGAVFRCSFNYRADFRAESAFLVKNDEGFFAIVGVPASPFWAEAAALLWSDGLRKTA